VRLPHGPILGLEELVKMIVGFFGHDDWNLSPQPGWVFTITVPACAGGMYPPVPGLTVGEYPPAGGRTTVVAGWGVTATVPGENVPGRGGAKEPG
jgi:hypothetical protein